MSHILFKRGAIVMAALLISLGSGLGSFSACAAVEVDQVVPDFEVLDTAGDMFKLSDHHGKIVVLEWTNHLCPFVRKHYGTGNMQRVQAEALGLGGVVWVSIVSSAAGRQGHITAEESAVIVKEQGAHPSFKLLDEDGALGRLYGAATTPHMFVIDAQGRLAYSGAIDDRSSPAPSTVEGAENYVLAALRDLKAGHNVAVSQTQPYGCSVKY